MKRSAWLFAPLSLCASLLLGCGTSPESSGGRAELQDEVAVTYNRFVREDPSLAPFLANAHGYVLFPNVGKGGIGIGGAQGWGTVFEQGQVTGYAELTQATIGVQLGGQTFAELVVFAFKDAADRFKAGNFSFSANASAVALRSGSAATAKYDNGVAIFLLAKGGMMFEASVGGQGFKFQPAPPGAAPTK